MDEKELQAVIKLLETLRDTAFYKSTHSSSATYSANKNGQYTAYHKAVEIIKKATKGENCVFRKP